MPFFTRHLTRHLLLALLLFSSPLAAQDAPGETTAETPEEVVERYFTKLRSEGLQSTVEFMHPDEMLKLRTMLLPIYEKLMEIGDRQLVNMTFGPDADIHFLKESSPEDFFSGFIRLIEAQMEGAKLEFDELDVLGHVPEGDDVHVLTRMTVGVEEFSMTQLEIVSMRPFGNSWRMQLTGEIEGIATMLQSQFAAADAADETSNEAPAEPAHDAGETPEG